MENICWAPLLFRQIRARKVIFLPKNMDPNDSDSLLEIKICSGYITGDVTLYLNEGGGGSKGTWEVN